MNKEHNYIELAGGDKAKSMVIYKKDNNLDGMDNLSTLPQTGAVYALCSRVNGKPANPRFIGVTTNLQESIKKHFDVSEPDDCLRQFMQSIKTKALVYELLEALTEEQKQEIKAQWQEKYKPQCNEVLNEVF